MKYIVYGPKLDHGFKTNELHFPNVRQGIRNLFTSDVSLVLGGAEVQINDDLKCYFKIEFNPNFGKAFKVDFSKPTNFRHMLRNARGLFKIVPSPDFVVGCEYKNLSVSLTLNKGIPVDLEIAQTGSLDEIIDQKICKIELDDYFGELVKDMSHDEINAFLISKLENDILKIPPKQTEQMNPFLSEQLNPEYIDQFQRKYENVNSTSSQEDQNEKQASDRTHQEVLKEKDTSHSTPKVIGKHVPNMNTANRTQEIRFIYEVDSINKNAFFTKINVRAKEIDNLSGMVLAEHMLKMYELSEHSKQAISALKIHAADEALNFLFTTRENRSNLVQIGTNLAVSTTQTFAKSLLYDQINGKLLATNLSFDGKTFLGSLAKSGVNAAFHLIHGDIEQAAKVGFKSLAQDLIQKYGNLPIFYSESTHISNAGLLSSSLISSISIRHNFDFNAISHLSMGAHLDHSFTTYNKSNFVVNQEAWGIGGHISFGSSFDASLGLMSGVERSEPLISYTNELKITEIYERNFENALTFGFRLGDRSFKLDLLPAFKSREIWYKREEMLDGSYFDTRKYDTQLYDISKFMDNKNTPHYEMQQPNPSIAKEKSNEESKFEHINQDSKEAKNVNHDLLTQSVFKPYSEREAPRVENDVFHDKSDQIDKTLFWKDKKETCEYHIGKGHEVSTARLDDQYVGDEIISQMTIDVVDDQFRDLLKKTTRIYHWFRSDDVYTQNFKPNERRDQQQVTDVEHTLVSVRSKQNPNQTYATNVDIGDQTFDIGSNRLVRGKATADIYSMIDVTIQGKHKMNTKNPINTSMTSSEAIGTFKLTANIKNVDSILTIPEKDALQVVDNDAVSPKPKQIDLNEKYDVYLAGGINSNLENHLVETNAKTKKPITEKHESFKVGENKEFTDLTLSSVVHHKQAVFKAHEADAYISSKSMEANNENEKVMRFAYEIQDHETRVEHLDGVKASKLDSQDQVNKIENFESANDKVILNLISHRDAKPGDSTHIRYTTGVQHTRIDRPKEMGIKGIMPVSKKINTDVYQIYTEKSDIIEKYENLNAKLENVDETIQTPHLTVNTEESFEGGVILDKLKVYETTLDKDGNILSTKLLSEKEIINTGALRAISSLSGSITNMIIAFGQTKRVEIKDAVRLVINVGESYCIGKASQLALFTRNFNQHAGIVSTVFAVGICTNLLRNFFDKKLNQSYGELCVKGAMNLTPSVLQVVCATRDLSPLKSNAIFAALSVAVESGMVFVDLFNDKTTIEAGVQRIATSTAATLVGTGVSLGATAIVQSVLTSQGLALTATSSLVSLYALPAVLCSVSVFATVTLINNRITKSKYEDICRSLSIYQTATDNQIYLRFIILSELKHPSKGSKDKWRKFLNDLKEFVELRVKLGKSKLNREDEFGRRFKKPTWLGWFISFIDYLSCLASKKNSQEPEFTIEQIIDYFKSYHPTSNEFKSWADSNKIDY